MSRQVAHLLIRIRSIKLWYFTLVRAMFRPAQVILQLPLMLELLAYFDTFHYHLSMTRALEAFI